MTRKQLKQDPDDQVDLDPETVADLELEGDAAENVAGASLGPTCAPTACCPKPTNLGTCICNKGP